MSSNRKVDRKRPATSRPPWRPGIARNSAWDENKGNWGNRKQLGKSAIDGRKTEEQMPPIPWRHYGKNASDQNHFHLSWRGATNHAMVNVLHVIAKDSKIAKISAAIIIQKHFRRHFQQFRVYRVKKINAIAIQTWYKQKILGRRSRRLRILKQAQRLMASRTICKFLKFIRERSIASAARKALWTRRHVAATRIQTVIRMYINQSAYANLKEKAMYIRTWYKFIASRIKRRRRRSIFALRSTKAIVLQRSFRYSVRKVLARKRRQKKIQMRFLANKTNMAAIKIQSKARLWLERKHLASAMVKQLQTTRLKISKARVKMHNANIKNRIKRLKEERKKSLALLKKNAEKMKQSQLELKRAQESGDKEAQEKARKEFELSKANYEKAKAKSQHLNDAISNFSQKLLTSPAKHEDSDVSSPESSGSESSVEDEEFLATLLQAEQNYGATVFQRAFRAYIFRTHMHRRIEYRNAVRIQKFWRVAKHNATFKRHLFMHVRLRILEHGIAERERKFKEDKEWRDFWDALAIKLQRIYRYYRDYKKAQKENDMIRARLALEGRELKRIRQRALEQAELFRIQRAKEVAAAIKIQSWWRVQMAKKLILKKIWERELYAILLQSTWRRKVAYRILKQKQETFRIEQETNMQNIEKRTPYGTALRARQRMLDEYSNSQLYGTGVGVTIKKHIHASWDMTTTYFPLLVEKKITDTQRYIEKFQQKRKKAREKIPDNDTSVLPHEYRVGDEIMVRWRNRKHSYKCVIIGVHYSNFVSQITGQKRGYETQNFDVKYDDDNLLERHVPSHWITRFLHRSDDKPVRTYGDRGFDPTDAKLTEVLLAMKNPQRLAHRFWPKSLSLLEMEEENIFAKRNHAKIQLGIHRTQQSTLGSRRGVISFKILLGNQASWTFKRRQERKVQRLKRKYRRNFEPGDHQLWYECAPNRDLRIRTRRDTDDKLPVHIWVLKGPSLRHMVSVRIAGGWAKNEKDLLALKCGGWTGFKSNTVKASELPQQKTNHIYHRALLIEEMPKAHWSRLPFTMWAKYDAIERPISDVRISSVDLGQPNPCREEEMFFDQGYIKLPEDLVHYGLDPGTYLWVKWGVNKREKEEGIIQKITELHIESAKGSATTDHVLQQADVQRTNLAQYYRDLNSMRHSHRRLWRMVDQLALEDFEIELFVNSYNEIDLYGNGYIDWDTLLHYVGFDHEDMPVFFDYLLAFFPVEDDYGNPKTKRTKTDIFRFGDFVRFIGVYCMLDSSRIEEFCFNYADTTGEGIVDLDEMCRLITALQTSDDKKSLYHVRRMQRMMKRYFSKQKIGLTADKVEFSLRQFRACCRKFPRMTLPLHKLQYFLCRKIPFSGDKKKCLAFWKQKKRKFMDARGVIMKEHRKEQLKQLAESSMEQGNADDNFDDSGSLGGSSMVSGSIKSGLGTSSILLDSMRMSGASRVM